MPRCQKNGLAPFSDSEMAVRAPLFLAAEDSGHQKNAWVNSPTPANGNAKESAPLDEASDDKLVDGAFSGPDSKPIAIRSDHEHRLLSLFIAHVLGQVAGFVSSPVPISGIVESWCSGHGTRPFLGAAPHTLTQETPCGSCSRA